MINVKGGTVSEHNNIVISVVVPVYGCRSALVQLVERVNSVLSELVPIYEIILVEDGCPTYSWEEIELLARNSPFVKGIKLSRNFGQHEAITAGLKHARGEWVVVMDCDLQDSPEEIPRLFNKTFEGYDIVFARRINRQDSFLKKMSSRLFYSVLGYLTDTKLDATVANFGIYSRHAIRAVLTMKESLRYFPVMIRWVGFSSTGIDVGHNESDDGRTSYSWRKLLMLALGVMISFSDKPLRIIVEIGFWMSLLSAISAVIVVIKVAAGLVLVQGWASVMVSLWFIGGLLMMMLGVVGVYLGKVFEEVKGRPIYVIEKVVCYGEDMEDCNAP